MSDGLRNLTIRQLRALAALAGGRSVTAAANKLNLTQPAVTLQLQKLQELAGLPLVQRTNDGMLLTGAGQEVLMLSERAIAAFSKLHPKIDISLSIGNRQEIRQALRGYDLDFAIMGRPPADVDVDIHLIGDHPHIIIAPSGHRLALNVGLSAAELSDETFLIREQGSGTRMLMEQLFATTELQPKIGMEMSSNETIKQAVIAGLGIALISAHTVATELEGGRLVSLNVTGLPIVRQWFVLRRKDKVLLPPGQAMLEYLSIEGARFLPSASTTSR